MVTSGKERQAALAERRRAAGLVQVAAWVPASRKADLLAFAKGLCDGASGELASEADRDPTAGTKTELSTDLLDGSAATTAEPLPPLDQKRLRKRVNGIIARGITNVSKLAATANIPRGSLHGWLKGKALAPEHLPKLELALTAAANPRDRTTEGA